jgi:hypothetical protein
VKKVSPEWLNRDILNSEVWYTLCTSREMYYAEMKKCNMLHHAGEFPEKGACVMTFTTPTTKRKCCIVNVSVDPSRTGIVIAGLLVHEAVHIFQEMMDRIGEKYPASEQQAYGIQWISQQLMWEYVRQTS